MDRTAKWKPRPNQDRWASYSTDYKISGPHLYQIAEDVNKMCILLDWLSTTEEESITFA